MNICFTDDNGYVSIIVTAIPPSPFHQDVVYHIILISVVVLTWVLRSAYSSGALEIIPSFLCCSCSWSSVSMLCFVCCCFSFFFLSMVFSVYYYVLFGIFNLSIISIEIAGSLSVTTMSDSYILKNQLRHSFLFTENRYNEPLFFNFVLYSATTRLSILHFYYFVCYTVWSVVNGVYSCPLRMKSVVQ